jgi:ribosomal protein S18 acetylase RimI-like enzyme
MSSSKRMRRDLNGEALSAGRRAGWTTRAFTAQDASAVHDLLRLGYADGGGEVGPFEQWWPALRDDEEYSPELCILAVDAHDRVVGVAQCWTSGFIKDLVVHPDHRRQGIAEGLLGEVFKLFAERGRPQVDLKVRSDNHRAAALYAKVGMYDAGDTV